MPNEIQIYTDGACKGNPGPGGYGVVLISNPPSSGNGVTSDRKKELSGGFQKTTNNRMELLACIIGLRSLKKSCSVVLTSDSKYVVNGIEKGWAKKWRSNGWKLSPSKSAKNPDLWAELLDLCEEHRVEFKWVKGHNNHPENERCDELAVAASNEEELPVDEGFENPGQPEGDLFSL